MVILSGLMYIRLCLWMSWFILSGPRLELSQTKSLYSWSLDERRNSSIRKSIKCARWLQKSRVACFSVEDLLNKFVKMDWRCICILGKTSKREHETSTSEADCNSAKCKLATVCAVCWHIFFVGENHRILFVHHANAMSTPCAHLRHRCFRGSGPWSLLVD